MINRIKSLIAVATVAVAGFIGAQPALAAQDTPAALSIPISGGNATQGVFTGNLRITSFAVQNNALVASGIVTGTVASPTGTLQSVVRTVTIPVVTGSGGAGTTATGAASTAAAAASTSCGILHLELGPLDLDLLGLVVHLDRVVLDISAAPGAGNLLGNLLCSVTNLLNTSGALTQIANLLNQIIALL